MRTELEQEASNTREFLKYIFQELLRRAPIRMGKLIEIQIRENATPFPEFTEDILNGNKDGKSAKKISDTDERSSKKFVALTHCLRTTFKPHCAIQVPAIESTDPLGVSIPFIVLDPERVYQEAAKLGLNIPVPHLSDRGYSFSAAVFSEKPPQIEWGGKVLPVKYSSKQFYVCRQAFQKPLGVDVSWDEVASLIDDLADGKMETREKSVYWAVRSLNKRAEQTLTRNVFKWRQHSFSRIL